MLNLDIHSVVRVEAVTTTGSRRVELRLISDGDRVAITIFFTDVKTAWRYADAINQVAQPVPAGEKQS